MRKIEIELYSFAELPTKIQDKVINNLYNINVDFDWWEWTYEDAGNVGIKINGFDIDRGNHCDIEFIDSAPEIARKIMSEHGESCDTYKTASGFLAEYDKLVERHSDGINKDKVSEENEQVFDDEANDIEDDFLKSLSEDYLTILRKDYEYQTSREAIIETIEANGYEFTSAGKIFNQSIIK